MNPSEISTCDCSSLVNISSVTCQRSCKGNNITDWSCDCKGLSKENHAIQTCHLKLYAENPSFKNEPFVFQIEPPKCLHENENLSSSKVDYYCEKGHIATEKDMSVWKSQILILPPGIMRLFHTRSNISWEQRT